MRAKIPPHRRAILFMIFLMLYGFLFSFVMSVIFFAVYVSIPYDEFLDLRAVVTSPWFIMFGQVMALLVPLGIWLLIFREKFSRYVPNAPLGAKNIAYIVCISLLLVPAANVISGLTMFFFPNEIGDFMMEAFTHHGFLMMILAVAVTPSICEEIVFRGYIQSEYRYKAFWTMALMNGLFFGIIHSSPQQFFYAFAMGVVFAYMVHVTGSVRAGVLSHFVMNASSISLLAFSLRMMELFGDYMEAAPEPELSEQAQLMMALGMWGTFAIFTTTGAVFLFIAFHKHNVRTAYGDNRGNISEAELSLEAGYSVRGGNRGSVSNAEISPEAERASFFEIAPLPEDVPDSPPQIVEETLSPPKNKKDLLIDTVLILIILALYVIFVFA